MNLSIKIKIFTYSKNNTINKLKMIELINIIVFIQLITYQGFKFYVDYTIQYKLLSRKHKVCSKTSHLIFFHCIIIIVE